MLTTMIVQISKVRRRKSSSNRGSAVVTATITRIGTRTITVIN